VAKRAWFGGADLPWSVCLVAVLDERAEPGREPFGVDEVDEVPVVGPFLDLCFWQAGQPFALAVGGWPSEYGEAGVRISAALVSIQACSSAGSVFSTWFQYLAGEAW